MKTNISTLMMTAVVALATMSSCSETNLGPEEPINGQTSAEIQQQIDKSFDYNLTKTIPVTFNYSAGSALIEIYDADETTYEVASSKIRPNKIYSAFTGSNGHHEGTMVIPASLIGKKVYAFSTSIGVTHKVEGTITENGLTINEPSTRALALGKQGIPAGIRNAIESELSEGDDHTNLLTETDINIKVNKDVDYIDVTFVWGGAGVNHWTGFWGSPNDNDEVKCQNGESEPAWEGNTYGCNLYYYTYTDDHVPTAEEIEANFINDDHLVVANAHQDTSNDLMGTTVRLTVNGSSKIKKGTRIGWVVTHPDYRLRYSWTSDRGTFEQFKSTYNVETEYTNFADFAANWRMPYIYSTNALNPDGKNQSIRYTYGTGDDEVIVYGIEDLSITRGNFIWGEEWSDHEQHIASGTPAQFPFFNMESDRDYNDVMFVVKASDPSAIIDEDIPDMPAVDEKYSEESTEGTLLFEDLFPEQGDYDMNDLVITYKLTKFYNQDNEIVKLGYEFTPVWSGATYQNSFSFLMDGWIDDPVLVFENQHDFLEFNKKPETYRTFKGEVASGKLVGQKKDELEWSTFNPFITVKQTGYEVHLTKKSPSKDANTTGLDEFQKLYINDSNFPFAMNIPTKQFQIVTERVRIDQEYPRFIEWVTSNGSSATDWYVK